MMLTWIIYFCLFLHVFAAESFSCPAGFSCSKVAGRPGTTAKDYKITSCSIGEYSKYAEGVCKPCDPGYYTVQNRSASCTPCPPGHECRYPDRNPTPCRNGTYSSCIAQAVCTPCPIDQFTPNVGATHCISCPVGARCDSNSAVPNILQNARWSKNGVTVAGGHGQGSDNNQLAYPHGIFVDDDQTILIADNFNHRIVQWKKGDTTGQVIAGGNGPGSRLDQLLEPSDVLIDKETDNYIICDWGNRRVVEWSRRSGTKQGDVLIENIDCYRLAMDDQRSLYISNYVKNEVRRYRISDKKGTLVAGGYGSGVALNQLSWPLNIFVDRQKSVYVSDNRNHRVMKWSKGATEGIVVAGGLDTGDVLIQLWYPSGFVVDSSGTLYIAEPSNNRILRWPQNAKVGTVIVANSLNYPIALAFDRQNNLYVVNKDNHSVQRFSIE